MWPVLFFLKDIYIYIYIYMRFIYTYIYEYMYMCRYVSVCAFVYFPRFPHPVMNSLWNGRFDSLFSLLILFAIVVYLELKGEMDSCLYQEHWPDVKCKQPHQEFKLGSPNPLPITITVTLPESLLVCLSVCVSVRCK